MNTQSTSNEGSPSWLASSSLGGLRRSFVTGHERVLFAAVAALLLSGAMPAFAQAPPSNAAATPPATVCGIPIPKPASLPPANSGPVVFQLVPCFEGQGNVSTVEPQTYLYYIQLRPSRPTANVWVPYDAQAERTILEDFRRLWATGFLDDLDIDVVDYPFPNGVIGKMIVYHLEERQRIKIVNYEGTKVIDQGKIEEKLRELGMTPLRLDSFRDDSTNRRMAGVVRDMMAEKGYQDAKVEPVLVSISGGPKLVHLTFRITEGPKVKISQVDFLGNRVFSDGKLKRRLKTNKPGGFLFLGGDGVYQEQKFGEDAQSVVDYYRERGYTDVQVGQPELKKLRDSSDGKTRYMALQIPITEGNRYRLGELTFDGNTKVNTEVLRPLFKLKTGDYYNEKKIRDGLIKSREIYGAGGYFEFTGFPDLTPAATPLTEPVAGAARRAPIMHVTMRLQEGKQYFVNRITFIGNTTTRDNVIRREMRLYENGVFNTEALKFSIRRLNQLGYFKPLEEQKNVVFDKTAGSDNKVDVSLKLEEQNRNQVSFGAGVSQYDGVFGQLSFQTANFVGRGESLILSMQTGSRAHDYQIAFTEPYLFDRAITGSIDLHKRDIRYIDQFTQDSAGGNITVGLPIKNFTRFFTNYSLERVSVRDFSQAFFDYNCLFTDEGCARVDIDNLNQHQLSLIQQNPFLYDSLLIGQGGRRTISKITPTLSMNTVDNPISPVTGRRYTASLGLAGLGGDTSFIKPTLEGIWFLQQNSRISIGLRGQLEYIRPSGSTKSLPIFEKLFLGGGYSVRGYELRSIGPRDLRTNPETGLLEGSGLVLGGNKSMLFNAEYLISVAGPVRLILFYDAGQVQDTGLRFRTKDFKTSTGAEIRFFMPVLNVPFRLIFAHNPQREGVLDNNFQPEKKFRFRFDVGSTF